MLRLAVDWQLPEVGKVHPDVDVPEAQASGLMPCTAIAQADDASAPGKHEVQVLPEHHREAYEIFGALPLQACALFGLFMMLLTPWGGASG